MTTQSRPTSAKQSSLLRDLISRRDILVAPGASDAVVARLVANAGFNTIYATGAGIANAQFGLPDIGLITLTEMVEQVRRIVNAVNVPVIADADTGYGNPLNVMRAVQEYEHAGVAAIQIEDQVTPKKCGHFEGKQLIDADEMVQKIRAAVEARQNPDLVLIARTDALATHGYAEAVRRACFYAASGADVIFVEAPRERDQIAQLPKDVSAPLLFNMTEGAQTPLFSAKELQAMGYKIVIYPNALLRIAMRATQDAAAILKRDGSSAALLARMMDWDERQRVLGLAEFQELDRKFSRDLS